MSLRPLFPPFRVLQGSLNHCRNAQHLLMQTVDEFQVAFSVVAEPYNVPDHPRWFGDDSGSVAFYWRGGEGTTPCTFYLKEQGCVAVKWGLLAMIGCYVSPSRLIADYEEYLDRVADCAAAYLPCPSIVLGDFNTHSRAWGNTRDNPKGDTVLEWAAGLDLRLINRGSVSSCVRWQGETVVYLTWRLPLQCV
ncbi:uncharacterized protein [Battus philenor]|uniref:uncharacterized protein n=1 Tax=Battus philenor TaxID=42288 RepID=UPI0035CF931A